MTNRQFVVSKFPHAHLSFVVIPGTDYGNTELRKYSVKPKKTYYEIRDSRPFGDVIARGSTSYLAWRNAKRKIVSEKTI